MRTIVKLNARHVRALSRCREALKRLLADEGHNQDIDTGADLIGWILHGCLLAPQKSGRHPVDLDAWEREQLAELAAQNAADAQLGDAEQERWIALAGKLGRA